MVSKSLRKFLGRAGRHHTDAVSALIIIPLLSTLIIITIPTQGTALSFANATNTENPTNNIVLAIPSFPTLQRKNFGWK